MDIGVVLIISKNKDLKRILLLKLSEEITEEILEAG
jgi:hypothetical protein